MVIVVIREAGSSLFSSLGFKRHSLESSPNSNIVLEVDWASVSSVDNRILMHRKSRSQS